MVYGAIHVTDCHDTLVMSQSQQLRLHESIDLRCHCSVTGGAILEDCSRIVFYRSIMDIKDFNWLKREIPSPNFRVEEEESGENTEPTKTDEGKTLCDTTEVASTQKRNTVGPTEVTRKETENKGDEDDEL